MHPGQLESVHDATPATDALLQSGCAARFVRGNEFKGVCAQNFHHLRENLGDRGACDTGVLAFPTREDAAARAWACCERTHQGCFHVGLPDDETASGPLLAVASIRCDAMVPRLRGQSGLSREIPPGRIDEF